MRAKKKGSAQQWARRCRSAYMLLSIDAMHTVADAAAVKQLGGIPPELSVIVPVGVIGDV